MTHDEYLAGKSKLAEIETFVATKQQEVRDCIDKAREYNALTRSKQGEITAIQNAPATKALTQAVADYEIAAKRAQAEEAKAKAAERAKAETEAKAREVTEIQKRDEEIAALRAQLEAKG